MSALHNIYFSNHEKTAIVTIDYYPTISEDVVKLVRHFLEHDAVDKDQCVVIVYRDRRNGINDGDYAMYIDYLHLSDEYENGLLSLAEEDYFVRNFGQAVFHWEKEDDFHHIHITDIKRYKPPVATTPALYILIKNWPTYVPSI